mmetsp:Transcript_16108/g.18645  ORF Transcript_16108/g.18645 Transcript_16108/m.18645 type:complete len:81 (+) Transcript_16108:406-648(+)
MPSFFIMVEAMVKGPAASAVPAVNWMRTFTMSMGWMQQVANIPANEPVAKGLHAFHTGLSAMARSGHSFQGAGATGAMGA